ncbi:MAG: hypothetical protein R2710_05295 [Acidimicrobiales bacterium]
MLTHRTPTRPCSGEHGAKVVVNDLGASVDSTGGDHRLHEGRGDQGQGGDARVNGDDVSDWRGAQRLIITASRIFGKPDAADQQRRVSRDRRSRT